MPLTSPSRQWMLGLTLIAAFLVAYGVTFICRGLSHGTVTVVAAHILCGTTFVATGLEVFSEAVEYGIKHGLFTEGKC